MSLGLDTLPKVDISSAAGHFEKMTWSHMWTLDFIIVASDHTHREDKKKNPPRQQQDKPLEEMVLPSLREKIGGKNNNKRHNMSPCLCQNSGSAPCGPESIGLYRAVPFLWIVSPRFMTYLNYPQCNYTPPNEGAFNEG